MLLDKLVIKDAILHKDTKTRRLKDSKNLECSALVWDGDAIPIELFLRILHKC
jgi:hypothetical protein